MFGTKRFALALAFACAAAGFAAQNSQDEPGGVAAAIRFQEAEDAAAARQARIDAARPASHAATAATQSHLDEPGNVADAIRFQKEEDAAAARQARIEQGRRMPVNLHAKPQR